MNDELVPGLAEARNLLRPIDPPPGARARVRAGALAALGTRRRHFPVGVSLALAALGAAGVATALTLWQPPRAPRAPEAAPAAPAPPRPSVGARRSPSRPGADAPSAPEATAADTPAPHDPHGTPRQALAPQTAPTPSATHDSTLAQQIKEYNAAHIPGDDERTVSALRAFRARWPGGALDHEAELEIVAALSRLGRGDAARKAAQDFIKHHPDSARAAEMRRLAEEAP